MMKWLVRPKDKLSVNEKKKIVKDHYKYEPWANRRVERLNTGGAVAPVSEPQKMNIVDYIQTMNRLYNSDGGSVEPDKDPKYIAPKEMDAINKEVAKSTREHATNVKELGQAYQKVGKYQKAYALSIVSKTEYYDIAQAQQSLQNLLDKILLLYLQDMFLFLQAQA